jgi:hypothetical protein
METIKPENSKRNSIYFELGVDHYAPILLRAGYRYRANSGFLLRIAPLIYLHPYPFVEKLLGVYGGVSLGYSF